ncbi:MAG: sulfatase-like hydrolase/transferase [Gammaproteobacteria bacterium]|nr:sulfatase-like hydrolase/transferase [Gammaproteobacteria bacterium]
MRVFSILALVLASAAHGADPAPPNVVVILVDDLGYCDSELYGCDTVPTPNIKRIADEGVLFTDGYVSSPVCSPSRAALLTGRYQQRFGFEFLPTTGPESDDGLPEDEVTLADALKREGYVTGMVGKWHLGSHEKFNPVHRGFDEFFGMNPGGTDYLDPTREDARIMRRVGELLIEPGHPSKAPWKGRGDGSLMRGPTPVEENDYLTDAFTREAVAFIRRHNERPFFLYLPYTAVHGPLQVTQRYYDRFPHIEDEGSRIYAAMTSALDDGVGAVLDTLEEDGLEENTLVVFLSDNGAGVSEYCSNEPLRLGKQTMFEGGIRVPFTMKWPARIPQGITYEHPVSALDIFPTAIAAAGGELPADRDIDGVDLVPYLNGSNSAKPHDRLFWRAGTIWAARVGDWKLTYAADRYWLYDLSEDIGEMNNLADKRRDIVKTIKASYAQWNSGNIEPLWPTFGAKTMPQYSVDGVQVHWTF